MTGRPARTRGVCSSSMAVCFTTATASTTNCPTGSSVGGRPHLVIPYSYETNDNRYDHGGFGTAEDFARYMIDCFDMLYAEGAESPKMMSIGLHDRLVGRPGRAVGLSAFSNMHAGMIGSGSDGPRHRPALDRSIIRLRPFRDAPTDPRHGRGRPDRCPARRAAREGRPGGRRDRSAARPLRRRGCDGLGRPDGRTALMALMRK